MAEGPAGAEGEHGQAPHGAHEEPVGDGGLDRGLESGVPHKSDFSQILGSRLQILAPPPLQVTRVAEDEPHREGEDGPRCPRRRGVLVRHPCCSQSGLSD